MTQRSADEMATVEGFGQEWTRFDQSALAPGLLRRLFDGYFAHFPWEALSPDAHGIDVGCGSGRWAALVAPRVGRLTCLDASDEAIAVTTRTLAGHGNAHVLVGSAGSLPFADGTFAFGYSLGVLHHTPDPETALRDCVRVLRSGAPFLVYLYYDLATRGRWYRTMWRASDLLRRRISRLPFRSRYAVSQALAAAVYWPLARASRLVEAVGAPARVVDATPLSFYRHQPFAVMRNDALDRFGTRIEHRISAESLLAMLERAGLHDVELSDRPPYWVAVGTVA